MVDLFTRDHKDVNGTAYNAVVNDFKPAVVADNFSRALTDVASQAPSRTRFLTRPYGRARRSFRNLNAVVNYIKRTVKPKALRYLHDSWTIS